MMNEKKQQSLIRSLFIPRDMLQASFDKLETDDLGRIEAIELANTFASTYEIGKRMKGTIFIWIVWHRKNIFVSGDGK
ncbi:MAG: hypothetical protein KatS3mg080_0708 [Anoxybacillus sp.]|nr:MAG: hypothetical protein KatS3mg080_0708 [Anoxybacillus sp.]